MADKKITELTPTTGANLSDADEFVVVDVSADETKSVTRAEFFKNTPSIISTGNLSSSAASGYGAVEVGGPSGGLIDLKSPSSDDYDARIIYTAANSLSVGTLSGSEPVHLKQGVNIRLSTKTDGASVQGNFDATTSIAVGTAVTNGAKLTMESGEDNPTLTGVMATGHFVAQTSNGGPALNVGSDAAGTWYNSAYSNNAGVARVHRWLVGAAEAMRITIAGKVGIGTISPNGLLELSATTGSGSLNLVSTVNAADAGQKIAFFGAGRSDSDEEMAYIQGLLVANNGGAGNVQSGQLAFGTSGLEAMRIDNNGNVGIGTSLPNSSAILDVQSTTKGLRFPNMTTTQKNAMADVAGVQVFDTTLGKMCFNTGSAWETMTSS